MTKTNLVLLVGGALAYASLVIGGGDFIRLRLSGESPAGVSGPSQFAWEQPPGVPPTGRDPRPKRSQQLAWEQPPGVPPTGSDPRPKRIVRVAVMTV